MSREVSSVCMGVIRKCDHVLVCGDGVCSHIKNALPVGLEPTTVRLRAARSTD